VHDLGEDAQFFQWKGSFLDPHSAYLEPSDFTNLEASSLGEFGGLGIEVSLEDGLIKVITPIDETPAQRAGVEAGDLIIKLDGKAVRGMPLKNAVEMMRGAPGEPIDLTIAREGNSKRQKRIGHVDGGLQHATGVVSEVKY
jgi:carboxyl-terminal processing protease